MIGQETDKGIILMPTSNLRPTTIFRQLPNIGRSLRSHWQTIRRKQEFAPRLRP